jgi:hypothetical protein
MTTPQILHGARSEPTVRRQATTVRRRILRQLGLRASDLSGLGMARLDTYCRAAAKVELYDLWADEHGWVTADGGSPAFVDKYFAALNSSRLALDRLEGYLKANHGKRTAVDLSQYRTGRSA